jgi:hypothetical protein
MLSQRARLEGQDFPRNFLRDFEVRTTWARDNAFLESTLRLSQPAIRLWSLSIRILLAIWAFPVKSRAGIPGVHRDRLG